MTRSSILIILTVIVWIILCVNAYPSAGSGSEGLVDGFRPPSVPLIVVDPYFRYVTRKVAGLPPTMLLFVTSNCLLITGLIISVWTEIGNVTDLQSL